jgi:PAS domain S-box-containing protein
MKKLFKGLNNAWMLVLTYGVLFILLVIFRNQQFWNQRKASSTLVELVARANERHTVFTNLYRANINEEMALLKLSYSGKKDKNESELTKINSQIKNDDSLFLQSESFITGSDQQQIFDRLKVVSSRKKKLEEDFFQHIRNGKYDEIIKDYEHNLSPVFNEFQLVNSQLVNSVNNSDKGLIDSTRSNIIHISNLNIWISIGLVILLIILGYNLIRIIKVLHITSFAYKESERKYRTLTEQTNEIIEKCNAEGKFVFANESFKKKFEYNDEELSGLTITDLLDDEVIQVEQEVQYGNIIRNVQKVFKSRSGKRIYVEGTILLEYKNGIFEGSTGFFNDVTEKKQLEESLKASELKFRNFFNLAPIPMSVIDLQTNKFISVNKAAIDHYQYSEDEFLKMGIYDIRNGDYFSNECKEVQRVKEKTFSNSHENIGPHNFYHLKKDGQKIQVETYTSPILINDQQCILGVAIDVTERNELENKITKAIIKTQEDERYEIGSELHDNVCQILAAAKMNLGMLKPFLPLNVVQSYNQCCEGILLATNEIRNLSHRLAPAFFENTKLQDAFENLLKTFNIKDNYNISMVFDNAAKNNFMSMEIKLTLYRILQEQLRNIVQYAKCTYIEVRVFVYNQKLHMRIADNGIGFDPNVVKAGIGIANMKRRAELFSGKLEINSSPGEGCEILIIIPKVKLINCN